MNGSELIESTLKFYYINMKNATKRKNYMINMLNHLMVKYERFEAIDGNNINYNILNILKKNEYITHEHSLINFLKNKKKLAIFMSHVLLWEKLNNNTINVILEDDVFIHYRFINKLQMIWSYIPQDFDILYLGCGGKIDGIKVNEHIIKPHNKHFPHTNHGLFGYIIKTSSIQKILQKMLPINNSNILIKGDWQQHYSIIPHLDWKLRHFYNKGITAYYLRKPLINHVG